MDYSSVDVLSLIYNFGLIAAAFVGSMGAYSLAKKISNRTYHYAEEQSKKNIANLEYQNTIENLKETLLIKENELTILKEKNLELEKINVEYQEKNRFLQDIVDKNLVELRNSIVHSQAITDELLKFFIKYSKNYDFENKTDEIGVKKP